MSYSVIIRGPLGVGKTTISKKLASVLHGRCVSVDSILEKNNLDKIKGGRIPLKNFLKADKIALSELKKSNKKQSIVVFDGNFYYKTQLENLIKNLGMRVYTFTLKASINACIRRDRSRKRKYGKNAVAAVHKLVSRFDSGIVIDTNNKTPAEVTREVLSHLPKI